jgi:hypothetical protein
MKVKEVITRKGNNTLVVIDELPYEAKLGSLLSDGERTWRITGAEGFGPPLGLHRRRGHEVSLILKELDGGDTLPEVGDELVLKEKDLLDEEVGKVTLRQFLEVWQRDQKDRIELAEALLGLHRAINAHECIVPNHAMHTLKALREAFNAIPPKWFHK